MAEIEKMASTAYELATFAASGVAVVASAMRRGKPIGDKEIKHLLSLLASCLARAPDEARDAFEGIAKVLAGKHYEGG